MKRVSISELLADTDAKVSTEYQLTTMQYPGTTMAARICS